MTARRDLIEAFEYGVRSEFITALDTALSKARAEARGAAAVRAQVEAFINQRPEYVTALKNTRGTDDQSDYFRWSGHAEARRQLAATLGVSVPHEPGDRAALAADGDQTKEGGANGGV